MGRASQLRLLLWKNFTIRKRQPFRIVVEIVLPLVLFLILAIVNITRPGLMEKNPECHFDSKAMPTAGALPFFQSLFCNADNKCHKTIRQSEVRGQLETFNTSLLSRLYFDMEEILSRNTEAGSLEKLLEDYDSLQNLLFNISSICDIPFREVIGDPEKLRVQIQQQNISLNPNIIEELLNSSVNLNEVLKIFGNSLIINLYWDLMNNMQNQDELQNIISNIQNPGDLQSIMANLQNQDLMSILSNIQNQEILQNITALLFNTTGFTLPNNTDAIQQMFVNGTAGDYLPTNINEIADNIRKEICVNGNQSEMLLIVDDPKVQRELIDGLCNLTQAQFRELIEDIREDINTSRLIPQVRKCYDDIQNEMKFISDILQEVQELGSFQDVIALLSETLQDFSNNSALNDSSSLMSGLTDLFCGPDEDDDLAESVEKRMCQDKDEKTGECKDEKEDEQKEVNIPPYEEDKTATPFCNDLFRQLHNTTGGRILWKQVKPMIRGKIPYTPDTPAVRKIIKEANASFAALAELKQLAMDWLEASPNYTTYMEENERIDNIRRFLDSVPEIDLPNVEGEYRLIETYRRWFQKYPSSPDEYTWRTSFNYTNVLMTQMKNYLDCFEFNKFVPYDNETALEESSLRHIEDGLFWSALVFDMGDSNGETLPTHISYKIRMDSSRVDTTSGYKVVDRYWVPGPRASPLPDMKYVVYGFIYIQDMIEHGIIRLQTNISSEEEVGVYLQQFPYPCYIRDKFLYGISRGLPLFMVLAWIFTIAMNVQSIVYEKEQRLKEVMKIMGLSDGLHWQAWFITCFIMMMCAVVLLVIVLKGGGVMANSDPSVLLVFLLVFTMATITFCFMMSVFFSKAKLAAAASGLIYFGFYLPYPLCYTFEEYMTTWQKSIASLSSPVAFGYACSYIARYEEQQSGIQWANIATSPIPEDGFSMLGCILMLLLDAAVYMTIAWYIEAVFPGEFGVPRPWYFFTQRDYWCGRQINVDGIAAARSMELNEDTIGSADFEKEPTGMKCGVSIKGLRKMYNKKNKPAVDGLNLNFYEGQITSFLGHNGAGKTTTMSILSGLYPPSEGTAYIYGEDVRTDMDTIRKSMGVCPQYNVLFDGLSVEDHLWFYARLKGMNPDAVKQETKQMIQDVGLTHKRKALSKNLSGGMKRKLSVAIAFVANSKVVILDEPTAGVDPCARRSIWDLLLKYRQGRTIMLSTHFMDEADVLGDRIAIISQGKLVTCGSSLFLKSRYGGGYYLTLVKQDAEEASKERSLTDLKVEFGKKLGDAESEKDEGVSDMDTNSEFSDDTKKSLIHSDSASSLPTNINEFIKRFIPLAKIVEDVGVEVTYQLPTGPEHAPSFEKLFQALDKNLSALGISSYGVSDTTLEEVFLKVADATGQDEEPSDEQKRSGLEQITEGGNYARPVTRLSFRSKLGYLGLKKKRKPEQRDLMAAVDASSDAGSVGDLAFDAEIDAAAAPSSLGVTAEQLAACDGAGAYRVTGAHLKLQQFYALIVKRCLFLMRSRKSFLVQIVWPALFVCLAQLFMTISPSTSHEPPMEVHPWLLLPENMQNPYLYTFYSNDNPESEWTKHLERTMMNDPSMGTRCMDPDIHHISGYNCIEPSASESKWTEVHGFYNESVRRCSCETGTQKCPADIGEPSPSNMRLVTGDFLYNMSDQNITNWLVETTNKYIKRMYGGVSFGEQNPLFVADYESMESETKRLLNAANGGKDMRRNVTIPRILDDLEEILSSFTTKRNAKIWFNNKGYVSNVGYMNILNNALLRSHLPPGADSRQYGISLTNHPMNRTAAQLQARAIQNGWVSVTMSICVIMALSVIPASFSMFLVQEWMSGAKHLQMVSGVNPAIYWISNFVWDTLNYVIACLLCIFIFLGFQQEAFISADNFPCLVGLLMLYGWAVTPLMYIFAHCFQVPSSAMVGLSCANIFVGFITTIGTSIVEIMAEQEDDDVLRLTNYYLMRVFLIFPQYCLGRGLIDMATNQLKSDVLAMLGEVSFTSPLTWSLVGRNLFSLAVIGVGLFLFILLAEYRVCRGRCRGKKKKHVPLGERLDEDEDVKRERQRVSGAKDDILLIQELTKVYHPGRRSQHVAVDRLTVGVHRGECFGLLGVNGAGKTSTFKMLTGDTSVSGGNAQLAGHSILTDLVSVHQNLGYCPQFDALCPLMTGLEHLTFYARLRGVPESDIKVVRAWGIKKLGLIKHAKKLTQEYSGGNKRKLSTAIALIGNPQVIFLDEPTTGMDPKARRFLWTCIGNILREGRSVILTSHSMEECEALCNRIGIMVNGRFRCLGSIQHIKNRFGEGYTVMIRVTVPDQLDRVMEYVAASFPSAQLKEKQNNMIQYQLPANLQLADVFGKLEGARGRLNIEDYSVSQTTLDQVFIDFAKEQVNSDDLDPVPPLKQDGESGGAVAYDGSCLTGNGHAPPPQSYDKGAEGDTNRGGARGLELEDPVLRGSTIDLVGAELPSPVDDPLASIC